jgi:selenocysteine lyase/cysteine desulfurase
MSAYDVAALRARIPSLARVVHLNCGGMAPLPEAVAAELVRVPLAVAQEGPHRLQYHVEEFLGIEAARSAVATLIGATPDALAFTTQFSTGVNIVVEGLPWRAGDEIITTDQEHPAMLTPLVNMARRRGLVIRRLTVVDDAAAMLADLEGKLTPRTRLLAVSQVTTENGIRLPARAMAERAHANGTLVLLDGAQAVGQFRVDVNEIGCDFYALVGYKWLLGPYPSAALYIRPAVLDQIEVTWTGSRVTTTAAVDMDAVSFIPGALRFEYGGRTFPYDTAMAVGARLLDALGIDAVAAHVRHLTVGLHAALAEVPGLRLASPTAPDRTTGIVTFAAEVIDGVTLSTALRERFAILTRPALKGAFVRASIAAFTDRADLDHLVASLRTLMAEAKATA